MYTLLLPSKFRLGKEEKEQPQIEDSRQKNAKLGEVAYLKESVGIRIYNDSTIENTEKGRSRLRNIKNAQYS